MKRFGWILILLTVAAPAWSANRKISVGQLEDLLTSMQHDKKGDDEAARELKQVELTEELTSNTMNKLSGLVAGPLSTEQIYVLEARSAMLAPPAADLPSAAPPDAAAQQALLAKASDYAQKTAAQLPPVDANRMTARFQNRIETIESFSGIKAKVGNDQDPIIEQAKLAIRLMNTQTDSVENKNGVVQSASKEKIAWGSNGIVASVLPRLPLTSIVQDVMANGNPKWLRWELINGKQAAVFSFSVDKKKSHYAISYCCFPDTSSVGGVLYGAKAGTGGGSGGLGASPAAHPANNGTLANVSDWKNFNSKSGYHGELFIDPASGIVVRTIVEAEFKPSDFVHYEDIRVDYASLTVGGQELVLPVRSFTIAEVVPNGDSFAAHFAVRNDLVTEDFKDYQLAGATAQK
jgi:hypothetical protein